MEISKKNPEKLEALTTLLPKETKKLKNDISAMQSALADMQQVYHRINKTIQENQLVNARKVAEYTTALTTNFDNLFKETPKLNHIQQLVDECDTSLMKLSDYFNNNYKNTMERESNKLI